MAHNKGAELRVGHRISHIAYFGRKTVRTLQHIFHVKKYMAFTVAAIRLLCARGRM